MEYLYERRLRSDNSKRIASWSLLVQRYAGTGFLRADVSNCHVKIAARPLHLAEIALMIEKSVVMFASHIRILMYLLIPKA
jgi:hypothetical protein